MSLRDRPPFRADHVGSLLRPPELLEARERFAGGAIDADALRAAEDAAIADAVALQRDVGLRTVTDGEFRRASWHMDFIYALDGVSKVVDDTLHVQFRNAAGHARVRAAVGPRRRPDRALGDDLRRRVRVPAVGRRAGADAEADDPLAEHGPLPRRPRGDRRGRVPRPRRVLGRT